jgi:hypothetical protein
MEHKSGSVIRINLSKNNQIGRISGNTMDFRSFAFENYGWRSGGRENCCFFHFTKGPPDTFPLGLNFIFMYLRENGRRGQCEFMTGTSSGRKTSKHTHKKTCQDVDKALLWKFRKRRRNYNNLQLLLHRTPFIRVSRKKYVSTCVLKVFQITTS